MYAPSLMGGLLLPKEDKMARHRSEIFRLSEEYSLKSLEYDAIASTFANDTDQNSDWNDYAYHEVDPFLKIAKKYYKQISEVEPIDRYDEIAKKVILFDINDYIEDADDNWNYVNFGSVFSEPQSMFEVFEVMPKETRKDVLNIIKRMEKIPTALTQWVSSLKDVSALGQPGIKLRVEYLIDILNNYAEGLFVKIAKDIDDADKRLLKAAKEAQIACEQVSTWLELKYLPTCLDKFAVGEERYIKLVKSQTGLMINPKKVYASGFKDLENIHKQMWDVAKKIKPDAKSLTEVANFLNNSPDYTIEGKDNFKKFLDKITKQAIADLSGEYFTIPAVIRKCEVIMDEDTIDESPYYKGPSDDLERPGRTYYPTLGRTKFTTWENYSTWFHESVPGHHMQIATATYNKETLTRYQREDAWNSGYGEGWALYAETLMDELGYFEDPGYKMGYLLCQAMRAARLVVDIGLHLEYESPYGETWTPDLAVKFMEEQALLTHDYAVNEVKRYISWAGQAITYKLGERIWLEAREKSKTKLGDNFNLKKWHMYALKLGPMGLDMLKKELDKWNGK
jgi:uncharacterized protein (DUF885 family)